PPSVLYIPLARATGSVNDGWPVPLPPRAGSTGLCRTAATHPPRTRPRQGQRAGWRRRSIAVDRCQPLALVGRVPERHLVPARTLEPEVEVVLPGEPDPAVHLHRAVDGAAVDVPEARLRHRRRELGLAGEAVAGVR